MLCAICVSIFQGPHRSGLHHSTLEHLLKAAELNCWICLYLKSDLEKRNYQLLDTPWGKITSLSYLLRWGSEGFWVVEFLYHSKESAIGNTFKNDKRKTDLVSINIHASFLQRRPPMYAHYLQTVTQDLAEEPWRVRPDGLDLRDIPPSTGHESVARLAKTWFESCRNSHVACEKVYPNRDPTWYPKRLIATGRDDGSIRLLDTTSEKPNGPYATLSHCWGENPSFLTLTATNIEDFHKSIPLDKLPKSFSDVITTCNRMGLSYLWIDSLCIIQSGEGSKEDWLFHAKEMHFVYLNCALNIAIDHAKNPNVGAFVERNPARLQPCSVLSLYLDDLHRSFEPTYLRGERQPVQAITNNPVPVYNLHTRADLYAEIRDSMPLSKRGWVLQEGLLSPRKLHFLPDRISWQCDECRDLNEHEHTRYGQGYQSLLSRKEDEIQINLCSEWIKREPIWSWWKLVHIYTKKHFSNADDDKLVALGALAAQFEPFRGTGYAAGTFCSNNPPALLWSCIADKRPTGRYRAPSWSWASRDSITQGYDSFSHAEALATVDEVRVDLIDPDNVFGQVKYAHLRITGMLLCFNFDISQHQQRFQLESDSYHLHHPVIDGNFWLKSDEPLSFNSSCKIFLIAIAVKDSGCGKYCDGLALRIVDCETYARIGIFRDWWPFDGLSRKPWERKTITII